jgi:DNA-binding CsgD family transcriptional regulator
MSIDWRLIYLLWKRGMSPARLAQKFQIDPEVISMVCERIYVAWWAKHSQN